MSILDDFEKRIQFEQEYCLEYYEKLDTEELLSYSRQLESMNNELVAMLRKHTFKSGDGYGSEECCIECGSMETGEDHTPDCKLAKLIGGKK